MSKIPHLKKFNYNTENIGFRELFSNLYGINDLSQIHTYLPSFKGFETPHDSWHLLYKIFYSNFNDLFKETYERFLEELLVQLNEPFYYQKIPCVRFGLPQNKWLKEFHKDSDYGHPYIEQNFNVAITDINRDNCLWIENKKDGDLIPLTLSYGEYVAIDHINCLHGAKFNSSSRSMVSIDLRIITVKDYTNYKNTDQESINTHQKFKVGHYFSSEIIG